MRRWDEHRKHEGIGLLTRDESRHIAFDIRLLRELVTSDPACINGNLPLALKLPQILPVND